GRHEVILNRGQAIRWAVRHADRGCILLAGCGAESWLSSDEGLLASDESIAKAAIAEKLANSAAAAPAALSIFPPSSASGAMF
ncbi:MAG: hypothetical protein ACTHK7_05385, partial [Aureliella sp.]